MGAPRGSPTHHLSRLGSSGGGGGGVGLRGGGGGEVGGLEGEEAKDGWRRSAPGLK